MNKIYKTFRAGLALSAGLVAMYSCSDTWDDHYDGSSVSGNSYAGTLMQALEEKASDFAKVVKAYGYDRELASDNFYTVWAPENGSFNLSDYVDENGKRVADSTDVVKHFLKSHIARYAVSLGRNDQNLTLLNEKRAVLNATDSLFGESKIDMANLSTKNGVLYTIAEPNPYSYNLFELIEKQYKEDQAEGKETLSLYAYLYNSKYNKDSLIEDKSVSRGYDENGNKIWVDSFLLRNNTVLKNLESEIYEEDSSYIAILPSAKAWQERYNIAKSLLKFNPSEDERAEGACDSLQRHYANTFAMVDLFYNMTNNAHMEDSLVSTDRRISRDPIWYHKYYSKVPKDLHPDREVNDILAKSGDPIECSNGVGYMVDEYPMSVQEQFFTNRYITPMKNVVNMDLDAKGSTKYTKNVNTAFQRKNGSFTNRITDEEDNVVSTSREDYSYMTVAPDGNTNPVVAFNVENNLSGLYDIFVVVCPFWLDTYDSSNETFEPEIKPYKFSAAIIERNDKGEYPAKGTDIAKTIYSSSELYKDPEDPSKGVLLNDTLYLGSYDFKYTYYGRNDAGVLLQFTSKISSKETKTYSRTMLISKIILKARGYHSGEGENDIVLLPSAYVVPDSEEQSTKNSKNEK